MRRQIEIEATGANLAVIFNTDDLQKVFGADRAIEIGKIEFQPLSRSAINLTLIIDTDQKIDQTSGPNNASTIFPFAQIGLTQVAGNLGSFSRILHQGSSTMLFRQLTSDVANPVKEFSPRLLLTNTLIVGWSADVDFNLEFDFIRSDKPWNFREEVMDLLGNKTQVEDPSISNIDGKRSLNRRPLLLVDE